MGRKIKHKGIRPTFFKVLLGDFSRGLRIPPAFVKNFNGNSLGKCIVKSPIGRYWVVNMDEKADGLYFGKGWQEFVIDHSLQEGDFLIFKYCGNSKFKVKIYDKSACEKVIRPAKWDNEHCACCSKNGNQNESRVTSEVYVGVNEEEPLNLNKGGFRRLGKNPVNEGVSKPTGRSACTFTSEDCCFIFTWSECHKYYGTIPTQVAREKGLKTGKLVLLMDPAGKSWPVELSKRNDGRVRMKDGWIDFCRGNGVEIGDDLIFEFVMPNVMQVHIFRGEGRLKPIKTTVFGTNIVKRL